MKSPLRQLGLLGLMLFGAGSATAITIYDNLGPTDSYFPSSFSQAIGPTGFGMNFLRGYQFTAGASGRVTSIDVAVGNATGPATMRFGLYSDNGGQLGALLEEIDVVATIARPPGAVETGAAAGTTTLLSGNTYWLMASSSAPTTWNLNGTGGMARIASSTTGPSGTVSYSGPAAAGGFRINAVPATGATFTFLSLGLIGLGLARRKLA